MNYYLAKRLQDIAKEGHDYAVFGKPIDGLKLRTDGTVRQRQIWLKRKTKLEFDKAIKADRSLLKKYNEYQNIIKGKTKAGKKLAAQFGAWLRTTGITAKEINKLTNSFMATHYLCDKENGQPAIPTDEMWEKLKQSPKLENIPEEIELLCDSKKRIEKLLKAEQEAHADKLKQIEKLKQMERLEKLERLTSLEAIYRLQMLSRIENAKNVQINCGSYEDYEYREGDVVYCDPPYEGTSEYSQESFDHAAFYDWVASCPFQVFFSSYNNISDKRFKMIYAMPKRAQMCGTRVVKYNYECIYTNR